MALIRLVARAFKAAVGLTSESAVMRVTVASADVSTDVKEAF